MRNGNDVIVVGAGIVGSSVAFHLTEAGLKPTLAEQFHPAGGPSGKSSALLHAFYLMPALSQLAKRGRDILVSLPDIVGEGSFVNRIGMMWVCGTEFAGDWAAAAERIRGEGAQMETLSDGQFADAAPSFSQDEIAPSLWEPEYGYADAFGATNAIARGARKRGARLLQSTLVGLIRKGNRITGVTLSDGTVLETDVVVLAVGRWTRRLLITAGLDLPLHVERHPMAVLDARGDARDYIPFTWCDDISRNCARPDAGGGTGTRYDAVVYPRRVENPDIYMEGVEEAECVEILETFLQRVPTFSDLGIRPGYAGLYDMSPDDLPVVGAMPGVDGLIVSAGSSGHGFKTGPAVGEAIAKLITIGAQAALGSLSPSRFQAA